MYQRPLDEFELDEAPHFSLMPRALDAVLGRVLIPQQISLLHGPSRGPLTALAHLAAVCAVRKGDGRSFFLDAASNYSPTLARTLCGRSGDASEVLSRITVGRLLSLSDLRQAASDLAAMTDIRIVVIDSLTSVLNMSGGPSSAGRQRELFRTFEELRTMVNKTGTHVLMTDHSSLDWTSGQPSPIGGNIVAHNVDSVVRIGRLDARDDLVSIFVERCPLAQPPTGVIVSITSRGIRGIK